MAERPHIAITGLGAVSAVGVGLGALWEAMDEGREGIAPLQRFDPLELAVTLAGQVGSEHDSALEAAPDRCSRYALTAALEAWRHAQVARAGLDPARLAIVMGTSSGTGEPELHRFADEVADRLGIDGPRLTISTACSSSGAALGVAESLLQAGWADLVLAGGSDEILESVYAGFGSLGIVSDAPCAPFSHPAGITLGEGAGFAVLETAAQAARRDAPALAMILGHALSADAYHLTSPDPSGQGVARGLAAALQHGGVDPEQVGYVNVHGTGTVANDAAEWKAVQKVLGAHAQATPVSASKSQIGHTQGAAGILEAALTIHGLQQQVLPPTLHFTTPRPGSPTDPVAQQRPRPHAFDVALSTNSAFGGANASVVLGRTPTADADCPDASRRGPRSSRPVYVKGAAAVAAHGLTLEAFDKHLAGRPEPGRQVPDFRLEGLVRGLDPRGLDPSERYLTAAAALALADGGLRVRGALRERTGLIAGASRISPATALKFATSIHQRGLLKLSATAYARMVLNAPAGTCTMALALRGPTTTLSTGAGGGLAALVMATEMLCSRQDADFLLAGGYDELTADELEKSATLQAPGQASTGPRAPSAEGAGCLLLCRSEGLAVPATERRIRAAGWALAGPDQAAAAAAAALDLADSNDGADLALFAAGAQQVARRLPNLNLTLVADPSAALGYARAASSALAAVAAVQALRQARCDRALVLSDEGQSSAALLLTREEGLT